MLLGDDKKDVYIVLVLAPESGPCKSSEFTISTPLEPLIYYNFRNISFCGCIFSRLIEGGNDDY